MNKFTVAKPISVKYILLTTTIFVFLALFGCEGKNSNRAQSIIDECIALHGGSSYDPINIGFTFRQRRYSISKKGSDYVYTRTFVDSLGRYQDRLDNQGFSRMIEGEPVNLTPKDSSKYANSLNSVIYFTLLPLGLNDGAVKKELLEPVKINDQPYYSIKVTFEEKGGGKDFQDEFRYWIHQDKKTMDFFAYQYDTDGGGTRFRSRFETIPFEGILFQNYINYKPDEKFTDLDLLPKMYQDGQLEELSRIINEDFHSTRRTDE